MTTAVLLAVLSAAPGEASETWEIPRSEEEIIIDGVLDDVGWQNALVFSLDYETNPGENIPPPAETECRMLYTQTHLYYGCHAFDPEPDKIRARYSDRDRSFPNDDVLGLAVDPFNLNNTSFVFDVNPLGVQNDRVYSEVIGRSDPSWDALWDSAGQIVDDGYVVEAKIPFAALRFPRSDGQKQTWGFNFRRYRPRDAFTRISIYPFDRNNSCRLCQSDELVGFEDIDQGNSLEITPSVVAIGDSEIDEFPDGELQSDGSDVDPGLFVSWGMTPNLHLAGALNPDFSQVEADNIQLDVNERFALFFPERRPFFLEGANFFDSRIRAVNTRAIADPDWGIKLTGQEGRNGIGVLAAGDARTELLFPGPQGSDTATLDEESTDAIVRYRRDIGEASTVGLLFTGREGDDYSNAVGGFDTKIRFATSNIIQAQYLQSQTEYPSEIVEDYEQPEGQFDDRAFSLSYRHERRSWSVRSFYQDFGENFRADLGFVPRVDRRFLVLGGEYQWFSDGDNWWNRIRVGGDWDKSETQDADPLGEEWEVFASINGTLQSNLFVNLEQSSETYEGITFRQNRFFIFGGFQPTAWFGFVFEVAEGDAIDYSEARPGKSLYWSPGIEFLPGKHVTGSLFYSYNNLDIDQGELFNTSIIELRVIYQMTARAFIRLIGQYYTIDQNPDLYENPEEIVPSSETLLGQLLFSYRLNARTALYLGYTSGYLDEFNSGLIQTDETLFFKVSYAWTP